MQIRFSFQLHKKKLGYLHTVAYHCSSKYIQAQKISVMPAIKTRKKSNKPVSGDTVNFNQTLSIPAYEALRELQAEKSFDSPQAVIRVIVTDYLRKSGKKVS
jgi:hypothetical protein